MEKHYAFVKITNVSGSTQRFPFVPPNGVKLTNGSSVTRAKDEFADMSDADRDAMNIMRNKGYIRVEEVPATDTSGFWKEEVVVESNFPESGVNQTGVVGYVFDSDRRPARRMKILSAELHVLGVQGATKVGPHPSREITLQKDGVFATRFTDITPTAPDAGVSIPPSKYREAPEVGDVIELDGVYPSADIVTGGSTLSIYITAGGTGQGATGTMRVRLAPAPTAG